jgi:hypothetical protein
VQAGQSLSITCKASDAKPAAAIKWRKNGVLFTPSEQLNLYLFFYLDLFKRAY